MRAVLYLVVLLMIWLQFGATYSRGSRRMRELDYCNCNVSKMREEEVKALREELEVYKEKEQKLMKQFEEQKRRDILVSAEVL